MQQDNQQPNSVRYDYTMAGFNAFMTRSIDSTLPTSLGADAPRTSNALNFDRQSVGGFLGDTLQVGGVRIEKKSIIMNDGQNDFLIMGDDGS